MTHDRVKVIINCKQCGERYTLRGSRRKDKINTGFLRCVCNNDQDLEWITEEV